MIQYKHYGDDRTQTALYVPLQNFIHSDTLTTLQFNVPLLHSLYFFCCCLLLIREILGRYPTTTKIPLKYLYEMSRLPISVTWVIHNSCSAHRACPFSVEPRGNTFLAKYMRAVKFGGIVKWVMTNWAHITSFLQFSFSRSSAVMLHNQNETLNSKRICINNVEDFTILDSQLAATFSLRRHTMLCNAWKYHLVSERSTVQRGDRQPVLTDLHMSLTYTAPKNT